MAHMRFLIAAMASTSASIAFQIGLATGHFKSYEWAMYPLFVFSGALWIAWLILTFYHRPKEDQQSSPESAKIHQENKQTIDFRPQQNLYIGTGSSPETLASERENAAIEKLILDYMREHKLSDERARGFEIDKLANALKLPLPETRDALERMKAKRILWTVNLMEAMQGVAYFLEDVYLK